MRFDKKASILQEASQLMASGPGLSKALSRLLAQLAKELPIDAIMLWILHPKEVGTPGLLSTGVTTRKSNGTAGSRAFRLPVTRELIEANVPIVSNRLDEDERILHRHQLLHEGFRSSIGLPAVVRGQAQGAAFFFTRKPQVFPSNAARFLGTLTDTFALHIHNTRLQRRMNQLAARLENASEDKEEFLSLLSRELRTPLTIVLGHAAMMHDGMLGQINPMQESGLRAIMRSSRDLLEMVKDELEQRVVERTAELSKTVEVLREENVQRRRMEHDLRRSREQLRELSRRVLSAQEDERRRIAREVHDELGQALTAMKIDLTWIDQKSSEDGEGIRVRTTRMIELVDRTIQEVRRIASELRPGVLDDLGLVAAIEWQTQAFQSRTGIRTHLKIPPGIQIPDQARSTAVFRIFQEALTNVARHAHATEVKIRLTTRRTQLCLEVEDNGRGIKEGALANSKSFGLMGMRERVLPWGGAVEISSPKDGGTAVVMKIPVRREKATGTTRRSP